MLGMTAPPRLVSFRIGGSFSKSWCTRPGVKLAMGKLTEEGRGLFLVVLHAVYFEKSC